MKPIHERLDAALAACGCPPLRAGRAFRQLGAGAWHDAYRVTTADGARRVVRLRKAIIYGRRERYDEAAIRSDYAGVGVYYAAANGGIPGICPPEYHYAADPTRTCTVESYLRPALALDRVTPDTAFAIGRGSARASAPSTPCPRRAAAGPNSSGHWRACAGRIHARARQSRRNTAPRTRPASRA